MINTIPPAAEPADGYVFADTDTATHHDELLDHLSAMLDPFTRRRLLTAGARPGLRCLEIGAGNGSIAGWLANQVVPGGGEVVATDLDPSHVPAYPGVTVLAHNIATDSLPGQFDLIHARLVLAHLPDRREVLERLVVALKPGGALALDEFEASWDRCVMDTPDEDVARLFVEYHEALVHVLERSGTDPSWGRRVHQAMRQVGLVDVQTEFWAASWHGGEAGCLLPFTAAAQLGTSSSTPGWPPPTSTPYGIC